MDNSASPHRCSPSAAAAGGSLVTGNGVASSTVAPADRSAAWRDYMPPLHDIQPVRKDQRDPVVSSRSWCLDALYLNDLTCNPISYRRSELRDEAGDYLLLRLCQEGYAHGLFDQSTFQTRPGEIHLFDFAKPCRGITERLRLKALLIHY